MRRVAIEMVDKDDKSVECPCSRLAVFAEVVSPHMHLSSLTHGIWLCEPSMSFIRVVWVIFGLSRY